MNEVKTTFITRSVFSKIPIVRVPVSSITFWALWILGIAMLSNFVAYGSIQPIFIGVFFLLIFMLLLSLKGVGGRDEVRAYLLVYSVCWFWAGITAVYAIFFNDPSQVSSGDAAHFFNLSTSDDFSGLGIKDFLGISEGSVAIVAWRFLYDVFSFIGFEKGRYIGVTWNITLVALSAVTGVKMIGIVFGQDRDRIRRFTITFALCGMFWLFAAIHNRDASILFAVSLLTYCWVRYLNDLSACNLLLLVVASLVAFMSFALLRAEFVFIPLAMLMAGLSAAVFSTKIRGSRNKILLMVVVLALPMSFYLISMTGGDLVKALLSGNQWYSDSASVESGTDSLGMTLIVNQPVLIRLIFGFIYMFIYPIPFWVGLQLGAAYQLLKSFHALFMYAIIPLFALSVWRIATLKKLRTMPLLFLLFIICGFTLSVAFTSLETRHQGAFLPSLLVIAMVPNLTAIRDRLSYRNLLVLFLIAMFFIHLDWIVLKFL
ncbi:MAG: hypothetical protein FP814_03335 [Desulfobacterium sp.]|nr:hypothetical protein [Desulfobacterium sp.]MBU3948470.1 hypothetical protein [Pseudomonadota bacterium]MBU4035292.1 hypothetical protein [Pseudomonadota bacterium]